MGNVIISQDIDFKVTIFTCVYNMSDTICRCLESVKNQTYKNIEHIVVNDGSTDNVESILNKYKQETSYPVTIINKLNGGKHTAMNRVFEEMKGFFLLQCDADDELMPNAAEFLVGKFLQIEASEREKYWCVVGRCLENGKMEGSPYPENINNLSKKEKENICKKIVGDKLGLQVVSKIKAYRFPEPKYVSHVSESVIWSELNSKYDQFYTNEILLKVGSSTAGHLTDKIINEKYAANINWSIKYIINNKKKNNKKINVKMYFKYALPYFFTSKEYKKEYPYLKDFSTKEKVILIFLYFLRPFGKLIYKKKGYSFTKKRVIY